MFDRLKRLLFVTLRIKKYKMLSDCQNIVGKPLLHHPILLKGEGKISFGKNVQIGVISSPNFLSHYTYIEARYIESEVIIGDNVSINNAFSAIAAAKITIDNDVLIGVNCSIIDTDGHSLDVNNRNTGTPKVAEVHISKNVFIGSNVSILKGVTIGENSIVGNSSVVTKNIPANVIAAGNPARIINNIL